MHSMTRLRSFARSGLRAAALLPLLLLVGACAAEAPPAFILRLRLSDGADNADERVLAEAVNEIEIRIDPPNLGNFPTTPDETIGDAMVDVTADGEWRLRLLDAWVRSHTSSDADGEYFDVPLWTEDEVDPSVSGFGNPTVTAALYTRTDSGAKLEIATPELDLELDWPIVGGEVYPTGGYVLRCIDGRRAECLNED